MSLEGMYRKGVRSIKKRDKNLAKAGTTAGKMAAERHDVLSRQLSPAAKWAVKNPDNAKFDNDGNPVDFSHWMNQ